MKKIEPMNTTSEGLAMTIKAGYFKSGVTNIIGGDRGGREDGFKATSVVEWHEDDDKD